jgi:signal transduction histidine kinase
MPRILPQRLRLAALVSVGLVAIAVPALLAFEAWSASRRHRQAAERALRDHADFAAGTYRQRVIGRLFVATAAVIRPLGNARASYPNGALPPPGVMRAAAEQAARCVDCGTPLRPTYYFRVTLADSSLDIDGPPMPAARRAALIADATSLGDFGASREWDVTSAMDTLVAGMELVYITVRRGPDGLPRAVYGFAVALDEVRETILRPTVTAGSLLPLPRTGEQPNDSVLSVSLVVPRGSQRLELSPRVRPDLYSATLHGGLFLGGWHIRVSLDPRTAPPLLIGGLPPSRAPLLAALVLLTAVLVGATVFVAWRALELARLRADFVAGVSHELRTPLAQILLFAETLSHGRMDSRGEVRSAGRIIVGEARRLMQLVDNVLTFGQAARTTRARVKAPLESHRLAPLVRETVESFAPMAAATDTRVHVTRAEDVVAPVDRGAIRQILLNLLDNAAKYGPAGQTIRVSLVLAGDRARLVVEDEGPGIPASDRERVWQPFARLPRDVEAQVAGSGIGLAVVLDLLARHGGAARIEDRPAGGALVAIELPGAAVDAHHDDLARDPAECVS